VHVTHAAGAAVNDELADKVHAESSPTLPQGVFNNYMGVGTDALIALRFHLMREKNPENFNSRLKNKAYYGVLGAKDVLGRPLKNLAKDLELVCDGKSYTEVLRQKKNRVADVPQHQQLHGGQEGVGHQARRAQLGQLDPFRGALAERRQV